MKYIKIKYRLLVYLISFTVFCLEIFKKKSSKLKKKKKKKKKKSSENDQLTGHFQSFFYLFFFVPPTLNLKKISRKSTNKKILALRRRQENSIEGKHSGSTRVPRGRLLILLTLVNVYVDLVVFTRIAGTS